MRCTYRRELESVAARLQVCRSCEKAADSLAVVSAAAPAGPAPVALGQCQQMQSRSCSRQPHVSLPESNRNQSRHQLEIPARKTADSMENVCTLLFSQGHPGFVVRFHGENGAFGVIYKVVTRNRTEYCRKRRPPGCA